MRLRNGSTVGSVSEPGPSDGSLPEPPRARSPIPTPLRVISEVCARLLVIAAAVALLIYLVILLRIVVISVSIAVLLAALLAPLVLLLTRRRVPRGVATGIVVIGGVAALGGVLSFVVRTFVGGFPQLQQQLAASIEQIRLLLSGPPFNISPDWLRAVPAELGQTVEENRDALTSGALSTAATVGEIAAGTALALFALVFFLYDGPRIWRFLLRGAPRLRRDRVDVAGRRAFASLVGYVRATALVAVVDAIGIGIGLAVVGVPLVVPLAALVFLGAFVPTVGAFVTGTAAVLVALVANGPVPALIVFAVVIGVQQLEGHVLQPQLLGRAVRLHPLAVVLAVAIGVVIAGIAGALLAVPLLAVLNTAVSSLAAPAEQPPGAVDAVNPRHPLPGTVPDPEPGRVVAWMRRRARPATD